MKTLVDCDFVFDVLTRGPFPPDDVDRVDMQQRIDAHSIESHLEQCRSCRELAEALVPSVELFHEALSEEERATLPGFNDSQMMARLHSKVIEAVFESEDDPERVRRIDQACQRWLAPAMVAVPVIAASILMWLFADSATMSRSPKLIASLSGSNIARTTVGEMDLPADCLTPISMTTNAAGGDAELPLLQTDVAPTQADKNAGCAQCHVISPNDAAPIDKQHYRCCTSCHASGHKTPPVGGLKKFTAACGTCHAMQ